MALASPSVGHRRAPRARACRPHRVAAACSRIARRAGWWCGGGLTIIASILGILLFIVIEVLPLGAPPRVVPAPAPGIGLDAELLAMVGDEYRSHVVGITSRGDAVAWRRRGWRRGRARGTATVNAPRRRPARQAVAIVAARPCSCRQGSPRRPPTGAWCCSRSPGRPRSTRTPYARRFRRIGTPLVFTVDEQARPLGAFAIAADDGGGATVAAELADRTLAVVRRVVTANLMTGRKRGDRRAFLPASPQCAVDPGVRHARGAISTRAPPVARSSGGR